MKNDFNKIYVLDTNIILQDAQNIIKLSDNGKNLIVLPETVLDEIDSKKSGFDEINFQAREFGRLLADANVDDNKKKSEGNVVFTFVDVSLNLPLDKKIYISIVSKNKYSIEADSTVASNILNDRKILEIAEYFKHSNNNNNTPVIFLSLDIMARTRAISMEITTETLKGKKEEQEDLTFLKDLEWPEDVSSEFFNLKPISDFDPEYKPNNFSYRIILPNGNSYLAAIVNKMITIIEENELRKQIINPRNLEQLFFSNAIFEPRINVIAVEAKAGSGKTLIALSGAIKCVEKKQFKKIIYIRNSIESLDKGEDVGYLAGNEEKFAIYNHPLRDSLEYIAKLQQKHRSNNSAQEKLELDPTQVAEKVDELMNKYRIETMWVGEMRGRTLSDAVVIIDEAQNMSNKTMQMVLSRLDSNCKVIVLGSNRQIDNIYINKYTNGLTTILSATTQEAEGLNLFAINLQKVLRGPITEWAEKIFHQG